MYTLRPAGDRDFAEVFDAIRHAADGVFEFLLRGKVPAALVRAVLLAAVRNSDSCFTPGNILLAEQGGKRAGFLFAYPHTEHALPAQAVPLLNPAKLAAVSGILGAVVPDTLHINCLWTDDAANTPLRTALLDMAEQWARHRNLAGLCTYTWTDHLEDVAFFTGNGFAIHERIPAGALPVPGREGPHDQGGLLLKRMFPHQ